MTEHIKVFTGVSILTNRLAFLLGEKNIPSLIKDTKESGRLAGFGATECSSELFIFNKDLKDATAIIEDFRKEVSE